MASVSDAHRTAIAANVRAGHAASGFGRWRHGQSARYDAGLEQEHWTTHIRRDRLETAGTAAARANLKRQGLEQTIAERTDRPKNYGACRRKAKAKLARFHARTANIRNDALHKLTTDLVKRFDIIGIENLNVRGRMANRHLARAVAGVGMSEFGRQLTDKAAMHGARVVMVDRWFPSSKTCSDCGHVHAGLTLSERERSCAACGSIHDQDRNAAINLKNFSPLIDAATPQSSQR
jgi:putative transposase